MVLFLHNRYRTTGGEERVVEDLLWLVREQLGEPAELLTRDSASTRAGRGAAAGLLRGGLAPSRWRRRCAGAGARVVHAHNLQPALGWRALAAARAAGARVVLHLHQYRLVCAIGVCYTRGAECTRCHGRNTLPGVRLNCRGSVPEAAAYGGVAGALAAAAARAGRRGSGAEPLRARAAARARRAAAVGAGARARSAAARARGRRGRPAGARAQLPPGLPDGPFALVVSRLAPEKGVDVAVDACRIAGLALVVAGDGPRARRPASSAAGGGSVRFLGRVADGQLEQLRAGRRSRSCPPARRRPSGLAVAESMAAGLPVIASRVGAFTELLEPEALVEAGDAGAMAGAIGRLCGDRVGRRTGPRADRRAVRSRGRRRRRWRGSTTAISRSGRALGCHRGNPLGSPAARSALITGIGGQDGSFLAELLLAKGYTVTGLVRDAGRLGSSEHLRGQLELLAGDLLDAGRPSRRGRRAPVPRRSTTWRRPSFVPASWERPAETIAAIAGSCAALLEIVRELDPPARLFVASSGAIFGDAPETPQREDTPCRPTQPVRDRQARRPRARRRDAGRGRPARELRDHLQPRVGAQARAVRHPQDHPGRSRDRAGAARRS